MTMINAKEKFSEEQEEYLKGFFQGVNQRIITPLGRGGRTETDTSAQEVYGTTVDDLSKEERIKLEQNGLDVWDKIVATGKLGILPEGADVFRYRFYGIFNVSPVQDKLMLRCRVPGGQLSSQQLEGLASIAEDWGGGYLDITTRAGMQIREIPPESIIKTLNKLTDLGLTAKGSGADNIRNVTASPTAGYDPVEILDVLPHAKEMHHAILNNRDLYGLPRKFNIAYDGGGRISACADTNDIAFYAVEVPEGQSVEAGLYFRVQLCGITGHKQFASDCGILIKPDQHVAVASAMLRVFIENGDRTNRNRARLKYLVDHWGVEKFLDATAEKLDFKWEVAPIEICAPRPATLQHGHIGVFPQIEPDHYSLGMTVPVGRLSPEQCRGIATIASSYGRGEVRLTVWQNIIIPHIHKTEIDAVKTAIRALDLNYEANSFTGGLIACTGNAGCKYAAANTKAHGVVLADELTTRVKLDHPINIHLTGCSNSCAQHYIGDIGLIGTPSQYKGESAEGYTIVFGGGVEERQAIAREVFKAIPFQDIPELLETCLKTFLSMREGKESFNEFVRRHSSESLTEIFTTHAS